MLHEMVSILLNLLKLKLLLNKCVHYFSLNQNTLNYPYRIYKQCDILSMNK